MEVIFEKEEAYEFVIDGHPYVTKIIGNVYIGGPEDDLSVELDGQIHIEAFDDQGEPVASFSEPAETTEERWPGIIEALEDQAVADYDPHEAAAAAAEARMDAHYDR